MNSFLFTAGTTSCCTDICWWKRFAFRYNTPFIITRLFLSPHRSLVAADSVMNSSGRGWLFCMIRFRRMGPISGSCCWRSAMDHVVGLDSLFSLDSSSFFCLNSCSFSMIDIRWSFVLAIALRPASESDCIPMLSTGTMSDCKSKHLVVCLPSGLLSYWFWCSS